VDSMRYLSNIALHSVWVAKRCTSVLFYVSRAFATPAPSHCNFRSHSPSCPPKSQAAYYTARGHQLVGRCRGRTRRPCGHISRQPRTRCSSSCRASHRLGPRLSVCCYRSTRAYNSSLLFGVCSATQGVVFVMCFRADARTNYVNILLQPERFSWRPDTTCSLYESRTATEWVPMNASEPAVYV
jgi:hypothetical protein